MDGTLRRGRRARPSIQASLPPSVKWCLTLCCLPPGLLGCSREYENGPVLGPQTVFGFGIRCLKLGRPLHPPHVSEHLVIDVRAPQAGQSLSLPSLPGHSPEAPPDS